MNRLIFLFLISTCANAQDSVDLGRSVVGDILKESGTELNGVPTLDGLLNKPENRNRPAHVVIREEIEQRALPGTLKCAWYPVAVEGTNGQSQHRSLQTSSFSTPRYICNYWGSNGPENIGISVGRDYENKNQTIDLETIPYNSQTGQFEFFKTGSGQSYANGSPSNLTANHAGAEGKTCKDCHQHGGPILERMPWLAAGDLISARNFHEMLKAKLLAATDTTFPDNDAKELLKKMLRKAQDYATNGPLGSPPSEINVFSDGDILAAIFRARHGPDSIGPEGISQGRIAEEFGPNPPTAAEIALGFQRARGSRNDALKAEWLQLIRTLQQQTGKTIAQLLADNPPILTASQISALLTQGGQAGPQGSSMASYLLDQTEANFFGIPIDLDRDAPPLGNGRMPQIVEFSKTIEQQNLLLKSRQVCEDLCQSENADEAKRCKYMLLRAALESYPQTRRTLDPNAPPPGPNTPPTFIEREFTTPNFTLARPVERSFFLTNGGDIAQIPGPFPTQSNNAFLRDFKEFLAPGGNLRQKVRDVMGQTYTGPVIDDTNVEQIRPFKTDQHGNFLPNNESHETYRDQMENVPIRNQSWTVKEQVTVDGNTINIPAAAKTEIEALLRTTMFLNPASPEETLANDPGARSFTEQWGDVRVLQILRRHGVQNPERIPRRALFEPHNTANLHEGISESATGSPRPQIGGLPSDNLDQVLNYFLDTAYTCLGFGEADVVNLTNNADKVLAQIRTPDVSQLPGPDNFKDIVLLGLIGGLNQAQVNQCIERLTLRITQDVAQLQEFGEDILNISQETVINGLQAQFNDKCLACHEGSDGQLQARIMRKVQNNPQGMLENITGEGRLMPPSYASEQFTQEEKDGVIRYLRSLIARKAATPTESTGEQN